jgi:predicted alpha/beta superfamily hydrolase
MMRTKVIPYVILFSALCAGGFDVTFSVTVPGSAPTNMSLYISGNHPVLGGWHPGNVRLKQATGDLYTAQVHLQRPFALEFKFTRGTWTTVECNEQGRDIPNRELSVLSDTNVNITITSWKDMHADSSTSTITGTVKYHHDFPSRHLGNTRTLIVYLPPEYATNTAQRYPVLYMHDGQNIFDAATSFAGEWEADETAERLISEGRIEPVIIVGIYNNEDRINEYTVYKDTRRESSGKGRQYGACIVEEVKPFIDKQYRTLPDRDNTAVAGSSLGGLISLYLCWRYPDIFSKGAVVSPALMWADGQLVQEIEKKPESLKRIKWWVDMGTAEDFDRGSGKGPIEHTRNLVQVFDRNRLLPGRDYYYFEDYGAEHNEAAWAGRFDKILLYLFGK